MSGFSRGGGGIRIKETDGSPSIDAVTEVRLPADMLVDVGGGVVSLPLGAAALVATPIPVTEGGTGSTSASTARTALGLGTAAVVNTGVISGTVPVLDGVGYPALDGSQITGISGGGSALTVQETDGSPIDTAVNTLKFPNGSVTVDSAGVVSIDKYPAPLGVNGANLASFAPYLRAGYMFNDLSGGLTDSVGVPHNMAAAGSTATYIQTGINNDAIAFGASTYFERPPQGFSPGTNEYTINWWAKFQYTGPGEPLLHWYAASGTSISLRINNGKMQLNDGTSTTGAPSLANDTWFMVTWQRIKDGGVYYNRIFQNGVQVINKADVVPDLADRTLRVGRSAIAGSYNFTADELLYYTGPDGYGAISAAAIAELWNGGSGLFLSTTGTPTGLGFSHADLVGYNSYLHDYWKFEESGTPLIDAISNNSLAATGSPTYGITGKNGNCVQFHQATSDYLSRTASFAHANNQEYSLSLWFYLDTMTQTTFFFDFMISNDYFIRLATGTTGSIQYYRNMKWNNPPTVSIASGTGVVSTGAWTHVVLVKTESAGPKWAVSLYCNGVLIGTETPQVAGNHLAANTGNINFGRTGHSSLTTYNLDGKLDECAYWKGTALDSAAVTALYNAGAGRFLESI